MQIKTRLGREWTRKNANSKAREAGDDINSPQRKLWVIG
jgi:hypothetical protein